jgi:two-component system, chemotaxis family, chemotaxis protein CheY
MLKALLVEDDDLTRRMLAMAIEGLGCATDLAKDGLEGVGMFSKALLNSEPYGIVFCDIMMPRLDGLRAIEIMRELEHKAGISPEQEAHIVMVTAVDDRNSIQTAMFKGAAYTYMVKPVKTEDIQREISHVQKKRSSGSPMG